jgi:hypothetical protein
MRRWRLVHFEGLVAATLVAALMSTAINAQTSSAAAANTTGENWPSAGLYHSTVTVTLGGFLVSSNINGSLDGSANTSGQRIDFDKEFGTGAEQTRLVADVVWRITPRQHLRLSYFDNDVQRTRTIDKDLPWGDYTFLAGGQVTAETRLQAYELSYEFAFLQRPNYEIIAVGGIYFYDLTLKLSGNASLTEDTPAGPVEQMAAFTSKSNSVSAPLPVLGLRGNWAVSPHVYLTATAQLFSLSYQGVSGNWSDLGAQATWAFSKHFGVGLGYDRFATHADVSKLSFNGRLNYAYQGLVLFVKGGF